MFLSSGEPAVETNTGVRCGPVGASLSSSDVAAAFHLADTSVFSAPP